MASSVRESALQGKAVSIGRSRAKRIEEVLLTTALLPLDAVAIGVGFILAYYVRFHSNFAFFYHVDPPVALPYYRLLVVALIPIWLVTFATFQLYDARSIWSGTQEYASVVNASTMGMMVVVFAGFLAPTLVVARGWVLLAWVMIIVCVGTTRFFMRRVVYMLRARGHLTRQAVILGANPEGHAIGEQLLSHSHTELRVIGYLDDERPVNSEVLPGTYVLGPTSALEEMVARGEVEEVIVSSTAIPRERLLDVFRSFGTSRTVGLRLSSGLFDMMTTSVRVQDFGSVPLMSIDRVRLTGINRLVKGIVDVVGALLGLIVLSPALFLIAIAIKLDSRGPVFHRRKVLGLNGQFFHAFKFRTMVPNADAILRNDAALQCKFDENCKIKEDPRITRVGRLLRRTSIDELPQLLNVLRGEMSLVGPRMITAEEHQRYGKHGTNLLTVKPGITGLWQISGRSDLSYDERVRLDMYYVRNYSLWLDLRLLFLTIPAIVQGVGAY